MVPDSKFIGVLEHAIYAINKQRNCDSTNSSIYICSPLHNMYIIIRFTENSPVGEKRDEKETVG